MNDLRCKNCRLFKSQNFQKGDRKNFIPRGTAIRADLSITTNSVDAVVGSSLRRHVFTFCIPFHSVSPLCVKNKRLSCAAAFPPPSLSPCKNNGIITTAAGKSEAVHRNADSRRSTFDIGRNGTSIFGNSWWCR